jgi:hypothetical protein
VTVRRLGEQNVDEYGYVVAACMTVWEGGLNLLARATRTAAAGRSAPETARRP